MRLVTLLAAVALGVAVHAVSTMRINKTALMIATMRAELEALGERAEGPFNVNEDITPFLERHGLTRDMYPFESELIANLGGSTDKLAGLFMMPCQFYGNSPEGLPVSSFDTRLYYTDDKGVNNYQLDRTYYIGDPNCTPNLSDIYFKLVLFGTIGYHGVNKLPNVCTHPQSCGMADMQWQQTGLYISNTTYGRSLSALLTQQCNCTVKFNTGTFLNISSSQCQMPKTPDQDYYLCAIMAGGHDYFNC